MIKSLIPFLTLLLILQSQLLADPPGVQTNRKDAKVLPLPKGDDVFHFIVYGDRTGGPAEGIKVLAQAVEDTNLLDPDLVLTVGDLINGYNHTAAWMEQMKEFHATMDNLKMPWFPVAGNHDIYWRADKNSGETKKPVNEHQERYEKHFGPLWYWFEHKKTGFLVLFTDEGHTDKRPRSFSDPEQQKISPEQLAWVKDALGKMKKLDHVFVFLHHPFWRENYTGSNWGEVHNLLAANGNVRAVLAGHIHKMTFDGKKDDIDYFSLATTGGQLPEGGLESEYFGWLHHFNVITVRKEGYEMASIPVGATIDPREFDKARQKDVHLVRSLRPKVLSGPLRLRLDGSANSIYKISVNNPSSLPLEVTMVGNVNDPAWIIAPDHSHVKVGPGEEKIFDFACIRKATGSVEGFAAPVFELKCDVLAPEARITMPTRKVQAETALSRPSGGWPKPTTNQQIAMPAKGDALRIPNAGVPLPHGAFTVEAWMNSVVGKDGAIVSKRSDSEYGLAIKGGTPRFSVHLETGLVVVDSSIKVENNAWTHLAGVYDGKEVRIYVNGKKAGSKAAEGQRKTNSQPLFVGARPDNRGRASHHWQGVVDEVRISSKALYGDDFTAPPVMHSNSDTVMIIGMDKQYSRFVPINNNSSVQALIEGRARVVNCPRPTLP